MRMVSEQENLIPFSSQLDCQLSERLLFSSVLLYSVFSELLDECILTFFLNVFRNISRSFKEGKLNGSCSVPGAGMLFTELSFRCRESSANAENVCLSGSNSCLLMGGKSVQLPGFLWESNFI